MPLISLTELSKKAGVTTKAIQKAVREGRLPAKVRKGKRVFDTTNKAVKEYIKEDHGKYKRKTDEPGPVEAIEDEKFGNIPSRGALERIKYLAQINDLKLKNSIARGEYINRNLVNEVFSKLYSIEKSQFLTLAEKLAPDLASRFRVTKRKDVVKIEEYIQSETYKILGQIKRQFEKFLTSINEKKIDLQ